MRNDGSASTPLGSDLVMPQSVLIEAFVAPLGATEVIDCCDALTSQKYTVQNLNTASNGRVISITKQIYNLHLGVLTVVRIFFMDTGLGT